MDISLQRNVGLPTLQENVRCVSMPVNFSPLVLGCFEGFTPDMKLPLALVALTMAAFSFVILKKADLSAKPKIGLIYLHLVSLFFAPVMLFTNFGCGITCGACYTDVGHLVAYSLPGTLIIATLASFAIIPGLYMRKGRASPLWMRIFVLENARKAGIKKPVMLLLDDARPKAFSFRSFRSAIFLSVGMLEILGRKELEAVLLHEIYHIKSGASALRVSSLLMRLSPFTLFREFGDADKEEGMADDYAAKAQGTSRHIRSARKRTEFFYRQVLS